MMSMKITHIMQTHIEYANSTIWYKEEEEKKMNKYTSPNQIKSFT